MDYLPLFLRVTAREVLLVGGGQVALRKARLLVRAGAVVQVVARDVCTELQSLLDDSGGGVLGADYRARQLDGKALAVAATDDDSLNALVAADANARNLPVNVVDDPDLCSFVFPSIVDRDPVIVAVGSAGAAPVLVRNLRARLESIIPARLGRLARFAGRLRGQVKGAIADPDARRRLWERVLDGPISELVMAGHEADAEHRLEAILRESADEFGGEVWLVGAGPGDPDLLTFRALRLMQRADIVLYDRLVAPAIVDLCRRDAERVYVGKARDRHTLPQSEINRLLLHYAREGKRVLRLKGGDPFIFGRGGEEIDLLAEAGIPFQVVPGITAASGCACYAGIPLTHRDYAQSVRFITAHSKSGGVDLPFGELVRNDETLVFYMGLKTLSTLCEQLIAHGRAPSTPAALIQQGTTVNQRVIAATLATLPDAVEAEDIHAPTLIIVGEVVRLHDKLAWFRGQDMADEERT